MSVIIIIINKDFDQTFECGCVFVFKKVLGGERISRALCDTDKYRERTAHNQTTDFEWCLLSQPLESWKMKSSSSQCHHYYHFIPRSCVYKTLGFIDYVIEKIGITQRLLWEMRRRLCVYVGI